MYFQNNNSSLRGRNERTTSVPPSLSSETAPSLPSGCLGVLIGGLISLFRVSGLITTTNVDDMIQRLTESGKLDYEHRLEELGDGEKLEVHQFSNQVISAIYRVNIISDSLASKDTKEIRESLDVISRDRVGRVEYCFTDGVLVSARTDGVVLHYISDYQNARAGLLLLMLKTRTVEMMQE